MADDILRLKNMTFHAYHGVWDEERQIGQRFEVDMELKIDVQSAAAHDKLKDTVDLYAVFDSVKDVVENHKFNLVETMAERISERVLGEFGASEVRVTVRKPHAPIRGIQDGIEVEIVRQAES